MTFWLLAFAGVIVGSAIGAYLGIAAYFFVYEVVACSNQYERDILPTREQPIVSNGTHSLDNTSRWTYLHDRVEPLS